MSEGIRIHGLEVENFKRIAIVKLQPGASGLTVIGGRNGQGKTSVLDAVAAALGGSKKIPTNLKRDGGMADPRVRIELENGLIVERKGKNFDLHIKAKDGSKIGQRTLDNIVEEFALDIPKFMGMKSADKAEHLLKLLGIGEQLTALDKEENAAYNERETLGRQARQKEAYAKELPEYADVPDALVSASELLIEHQGIVNKNAENAHRRYEIQNLRESRTIKKDSIADLMKDLATAQEELREIEKKLEVLTATEINDLPTHDLEKRLADIEATNAKVRTNLDKSKAMDDAKAAEAEYSKMTEKIEAVRKRRKALLDSAAMPLEGLTVEKGELLYNGKAWDCMATSEQIKVSIAIAHALKPSCAFVLLDRLEAFDLDQLREIDTWLADLGMQGIATRVSTGKECSVIIEDGRIEGQDAVLSAAEMVLESAAVTVTPKEAVNADEEPL